MTEAQKTLEEMLENFQRQILSAGKMIAECEETKKLFENMGEENTSDFSKREIRTSISAMEFTIAEKIKHITKLEEKISAITFALSLFQQ